MSTNRISGGPTIKLSIRFEKNTMSFDRRNILFAAAALATAASRSAQAYKQRERVSQQELDEAIRLHGMWLTDINTGQRCMFGGRDLSGLHFGVLGGGPVDLNGADFAQADLSRTEADDALVHHPRRAFHHCRNRSIISGYSMTLRSLRPLDCSIRMIFCAPSICLTFSRTTSPARRPHP